MEPALAKCFLFLENNVMKHLLVLSKYDPTAASSRMRTWQYIPALEESGFHVRFRALFSTRYLHELYCNGRRPFDTMVVSYMRRFLDLLSSCNYDAVWVEKELFPYFPSFFEYLPRTPYIVDYDDAIFHNYEMHRLSHIRKLLGDKLKILVRRAFAITAGNHYLAEWAKHCGARRVEVLPTVVDLNRYFPAPPRDVPSPLRVVWIGSPSTCKYLSIVKEAFKLAAPVIPLQLVTIGANPIKDWPTALEQLPWNQSQEVDMINSCDIGIMPLPDAPWERGKCGYKLIQYMACGLPVIASPVGVNTEIVKNGAGLLASTTQEWCDALICMAGDLSLRSQMGTRGRKAVEQHYSLQHTSPQIISLMNEAVTPSARK